MMNLLVVRSMGRVQLSAERLSATKEPNIGRIIIFCEGLTEKYYFGYFETIIKKSKYNNIAIELESSNGNARSVLNFADRFMSDDSNLKKFSAYDKYLVFDCDAPADIQSVIKDAKEYKLLVSNFLFETWLLMHFENLNNTLTKRQTFERLRGHINDYKKGHKGITREIIQNGDIEMAIDNARKLDHKYSKEGKSIFFNIKEMNPYTSIYSMIEEFMIAIS